MEGLIPPVAPAIVVSILVGAFQTCLYVVIRGSVGRHLPLTLLAAILGAFVGHLVGRLAGDPVQLGDFNVLWASVMAWVGIVVVAGLAAIRPTRRAEPRPEPDPTSAEGTGATTTIGPEGGARR